MAAWDAQQYLRFFEQRTRPAAELLGRVVCEAPAVVVDLGCGPGNSTKLLRQRWPRAHLVGVDSSPAMLDRARKEWPTGLWVQADAATYRADTEVDVLFSNALLHWLPNHEKLWLELMDQVKPGGTLAVQMPRNFDEPSHRLMRELQGPWRSRFAGLPQVSPVHTAAYYYDVLAPSCTQVDIWQTTYEHVMPDAASIVEWVKGTGLRPYLDRLEPEEQSQYLAAYTNEIDRAYPPQIDGARLFSFPRLFVVAQRR